MRGLRRSARARDFSHIQPVRRSLPDKTIGVARRGVSATAAGRNCVSDVAILRAMNHRVESSRVSLAPAAVSRRARRIQGRLRRRNDRDAVLLRTRVRAIFDVGFVTKHGFSLIHCRD